MATLALTLSRQPNKGDEAMAMYWKVLAAQRRIRGGEYEGMLWTMNHLCRGLLSLGKLAEAESLCHEGLEISRRTVGDKRMITIKLRERLGTVYRRQGRLDEAEKLCRQGWEAGREVLGETHQETLDSLDCLASALIDQGKLDEARPYAAELIRHQRRAAEQPDATAGDLNEYAWDLLAIGLEDLRDPQAALPVAQRAVEMSGGENAIILDTLARAYFMTGDTAKAIEIQETIVTPGMPEDHLYRRTLAEYRVEAAETTNKKQTESTEANDGS